MTTLNFTLAPDGVVRIHDAISCLSKFSEFVGLEAYPNKVGEVPLLERLQPVADSKPLYSS